MTTTSTPASLDEIYRAGLEALHRELGLVGMIRFLQQVRPPSGDFTAERAELHAGTTMDDVIAAIEKIQAEADQAGHL
jgi:hypothetical protein